MSWEEFILTPVHTVLAWEAAGAAVLCLTAALIQAWRERK